MEKRDFSDEDILTYLDGLHGEVERKRFEKALQASPQLQKRLQWLQSVEKLFSENYIQAPSPEFSGKVMTALDKPGYQRFPKNGLLLLLGVLVALTFVVLLMSGGNFDPGIFNQMVPKSLSIGNSHFSVPSDGLPDLKMLINGILFLNLFLALLLLERVIFRPMFRRRIGI